KRPSNRSKTSRSTSEAPFPANISLSPHSGGDRTARSSGTSASPPTRRSGAVASPAPSSGRSWATPDGAPDSSKANCGDPRGSQPVPRSNSSDPPTTELCGRKSFARCPPITGSLRRRRTIRSSTERCVGESVLNPVDPGLFPFLKDDFDHVEAPRDLPRAQQPQPLVRTTPDQPPLGFIHCLKRTAGAARPSRFDFGEQKALSFAGDDVDLPPAGSTEVAVENLRAVRHQPPPGDLLAQAPDLFGAERTVVTRQLAARVEQPAETSDDECGKDHVDGAL